MRRSLDLSGRVAVVTGASRGIGSAIASCLAAHGMHLILGGCGSEDQLALVAQSIAATAGTKADACVGDIADPATSAALAKMAFTAHRRLDVWVNNAGVMIDGLIGMTPQASIDTTLAVNLAGVLHGMQHAARLMARGGGGSIINIASIMGRFGNSGQFAYCASKAGVIGATLAAAKELGGKGIRVNAVAPGMIETDLISGLSPEVRSTRVKSIAMGRSGTPEDVADCVLFLASDLSRYVTGQIIGVDGGMVI
jgi:3-oxoacyl-[acyl-carrier protein] reductase